MDKERDISDLLELTRQVLTREAAQDNEIRRQYVLLDQVKTSSQEYRIASQHFLERYERENKQLYARFSDMLNRFKALEEEVDKLQGWRKETEAQKSLIIGAIGLLGLPAIISIFQALFD